MDFHLFVGQTPMDEWIALRENLQETPGNLNIHGENPWILL